MKRRAAISRRQFLTGAFRRRGIAVSGAGTTAAASRDPAQRNLGERDRFGWNEDPQIGRDFTAPETAPQIPDWDSGMASALEELANLKGIEDF